MMSNRSEHSSSHQRENGTTTETSLTPFAVGNDVLLDVARQLGEMARVDDLRARSVRGKLILDRCYNGSETQWRNKRSNKSDSIRRLAKLDECPFGATSMRECVGLFLLCEKMPFILEQPEINATHVVAVLGLSEEEQRHFLELATQQSLSGRALKQLVIAHRRTSGERRGRRRLETLTKSLTALRASARALKQFAELVASLEPMSDGGRMKLARLLVENEELVAQCRTLIEAPAPSLHAVSSAPTAKEDAPANSGSRFRPVPVVERVGLQTGTCG